MKRLDEDAMMYCRRFRFAKEMVNNEHPQIHKIALGLLVGIQEVLLSRLA